MIHLSKERIIGSIALYSLVVPVATFFSMTYAVVVSMIVFLVGKIAYQKPPESQFHLPTTLCVKLSYGMFIIIGLITLGLSAAVPLVFESQPMLPIIGAILALIAWDYGGNYQKSKRDEWNNAVKIYEEQNSVIESQENTILDLKSELDNMKLFKCATSFAEEIRERATQRGLDDESIEFLVKAHRLGLSYAELADMYNLTVSGVSKRKSRLTKKVES